MHHQVANQPCINAFALNSEIMELLLGKAVAAIVSVENPSCSKNVYFNNF
jgi:hypothetical protein